MGYRYQNNLDEENERQWLASLPRWKRWLYRNGKWGFMALGIGIIFWSMWGR